jgi:transposase
MSAALTSALRAGFQECTVKGLSGRAAARLKLSAATSVQWQRRLWEGAIIAPVVSPAMRVWVLHEPKWASMIRRFPLRAHPLCLVRFVFTDF